MKDHTPGKFNRPSGYMSDLEISETREDAAKVNTSFGSNNHNSYIHYSSGTHEHYFYDPDRCRSGYHGENFATRNNHPTIIFKESNDMKVLTPTEYNNMKSEFMEHYRYDTLPESKQHEVDAMLDTIMERRGYTVSDSTPVSTDTPVTKNNLENIITTDPNNTVEIANTINANKDGSLNGEDDDMQNRDEINDGHPYSLGDESEVDTTVSDDDHSITEAAEDDFEMEL